MNLQPVTISEALKQATATLRAAGVLNDVLDAQTLLARSLGRDRTHLIINFNQELQADLLARYGALIDRRAAGEPLQYITGQQEFYGLEFEVTPAVLIPRPETEILVEEALRLAHQQGIEQPTIIDVGTGSGCIAVSLARELPGARIIATDISAAALAVAGRNAARHGLRERIAFIECDLLGGIGADVKTDLIVSNPPYVAAAELPALQREVRDHEPHTALTDFADGLSFYRRLLSEAPNYLKPRGYLLCEMGYGQAEHIKALVEELVWGEARMLTDLQGIARTLALRLG